MLAKSKVVLAAAALLALGPTFAQADLLGGLVGALTPVELKVGPALSAGIVSFELASLSNGDTLAVEVVIPGKMTANDKGNRIVAAVAAADPTGSWLAVNVLGKLTFTHVALGNLLTVDAIAKVNDTTGSGTKVTADETAVSFTLTLDPASVAVGYDGMGEPSYITVTVTDTLTWTRALQGGETPQMLLDALQEFLATEAGNGVVVSRTSESSISVVLRYEESAVNWQVTDLGLSGATGEAVRISDGGMLIRRGK